MSQELCARGLWKGCCAALLRGRLYTYPARSLLRVADVVFEVGVHDGAHDSCIHAIAPGIKHRALHNARRENNDVHGFYLAELELQTSDSRPLCSVEQQRFVHHIVLRICDLLAMPLFHVGVPYRKRKAGSAKGVGRGSNLLR